MVLVALLMFLGMGGAALAQCPTLWSPNAPVSADWTVVMGAKYTNFVNAADVAEVHLGVPAGDPPEIPPILPAEVTWDTTATNTITLTLDPSTTPPTLTTVVKPDSGAPTVVVYAFGGPVPTPLDFIHIKASSGAVVFGSVILNVGGDCVLSSTDFSGEGLLGTGGDLSGGFTLTGTLTVVGASATDSLDISIGTQVTNEPPDCSRARANVLTLWPPNHKFRPVSVVGVTDPDGDPITISINSIFQDEPTNGLGDGDTSPDGQGIGTSMAQVRAERQGSGNGRVYHIRFTAADGKGGTCSGEVKVGVPKSQGRNGAPIDGGALYDSTVP